MTLYAMSMNAISGRWPGGRKCVNLLYCGRIALVIRNPEEPHCCAETYLDCLIWEELRRTDLPIDEYSLLVTHIRSSLLSLTQLPTW